MPNFYERQVQNKLAKAKRDASQQEKDSAPKAQSNVMTPHLTPAREGRNFPGIQSVVVDETPRTGKKIEGGLWSGHHGFRGVKWGQDNLELPWKMNLVDVESEVSAAQGEPGTSQCEIGRWSYSRAQLPTLRPQTSMLLKHRARASTLPDLYAKNNATQRSLSILRKQHCATFQSSEVQENYPCMGLSKI